MATKTIEAAEEPDYCPECDKDALNYIALTLDGMWTWQCGICGTLVKMDPRTRPPTQES